MTMVEYLEWLDKNRSLFPLPGRAEPIPPKHPGKWLQEEFIKKYSISQSDLARQIGCRIAKINDIVNEKRGITPEFAIQLEAILGYPAETWVSLQGQWDLWKARRKNLASE